MPRIRNRDVQAILGRKLHIAKRRISIDQDDSRLWAYANFWPWPCPNPRGRSSFDYIAEALIFLRIAGGPDVDVRLFWKFKQGLWRWDLEAADGEFWSIDVKEHLSG